MTEKEKLKKSDTLLQRYIDRKACLKLRLKVGDEELSITGFLLTKSDEFLFIQDVNDFTYDGYVLIRRPDVGTIAHGRNEQMRKKILKGEGMLGEAYGYKGHMPLNSWKAIFDTLKKEDTHTVIRSVYKDEAEFWIGPIKRATEKRVAIHHYDATGAFNTKATTLNYEEIRMVYFGDRYSTTFRKYLKPFPKK